MSKEAILNNTQTKKPIKIEANDLQFNKINVTIKTYDYSAGCS